jgi:6-phosphogluconolactonase
MQSDFARQHPAMGGVYMQSNDRDGNQLMAFRRDATGALSGATGQHTGGFGDGTPHLPSQGSVMLTDDGRHLLLTNSGSGDLSLFDIDDSGPRALQTVVTGMAPKSVTERDGLVYVLNTGDPSLTGFRLDRSGLEQIADPSPLPAADADPAQVGFSPDGTTIVVTERGANAIAMFPVDDRGRLDAPHMQPSAGQTPYGFAFTEDGALVVAEAFGAATGKAAASSYIQRGANITPMSQSVGNGHSEICWAVVSNDNRYVYTTNFADSTVSRYAIGADGSLTLDDPMAGVGIGGHTGLRDEDMTDDGRFLYAIDADSQRIFGWSVSGGGALSPLGSWDGLPQAVAGLAAS